MSKQTRFLLCPSAYLSLYRLNANEVFLQGGTTSPYSFRAPNGQDFYDVVEPSPFDTGANDFDNEFLNLERFLPAASTSSLVTSNLGSIFDNFTQSYPPKVGEF